MDDENGILSGVVKNDNYRRYSMRGKVSYDIWKWLTLSNNTSYVATERVRPSYLSSRGTLYRQQRIRQKGYNDSDMSLFYNLAPTGLG